MPKFRNEQTYAAKSDSAIAIENVIGVFLAVFLSGLAAYQYLGAELFGIWW